MTPDTVLRICSAEDLVVFKAFAGRSRDWLDIEGIAIPLLELKEAPNDAERLRRILDRARS